MTQMTIPHGAWLGKSWNIYMRRYENRIPTPTMKYFESVAWFALVTLSATYLVKQHKLVSFCETSFQVSVFPIVVFQ